MYPVLFELGSVKIHAYGALIAFGAFMGYLYMSIHAKKELGVDSDVIQRLAQIIIVMAFLGGKLFFFFEKPAYYFGEPANMLKNFRSGFVFYGSLIFVMPAVIWYFRKMKLPTLPLLDIVAFTAIIIHAIGRLGCFMAGCCYGKETDGPIFITYTDELAVAPTGVHLHPSQLYEIFMLLVIFSILWMFKRYKRFEGQLFFLYIMMYAVGRSIVEIFRGDVARGFIIEGWVSHSQMISLLLIAIVGFFYVRELKKSQLKA